MTVLVETGGRLSGWIWRPLSMVVVVAMAACYRGGLASLVDVLGQPAEALAVALPLQHAAHEHLQRSRVQLLYGNVSLKGKGKEKVTKRSLVGKGDAQKIFLQ